MEIREVRDDGWANLFTGVGTARDKTKYTTFTGVEYLSDTVLEELEVGDGFARFVTHRKADDMVRQWVTITGDDENRIGKKLVSLNAIKEFKNALGWMRHFGGALIVVGINDGRRIDEPVNYNSIKSIDYIRAYDRTAIDITDINFDQDPNSQHYGEPEFYTVTPKYTAQYNVHWTRCIVFKGLPVPSRTTVNQFWYWGMSVLQPVWDQVRDIGAGERNTAKLLYEFVISKYKIKGLANMMAEGKWDDIHKIMNIIELGKSTIQAMLLDADGDDYIRDSASVSGLPDLLDRFMMFLAGVTGYPVSLLFGRSAAGLNATGEGDMRNYYDDVRSLQMTEFVPKLQQLVDIINASKEFKSAKIKDPTVECNPLFQLTQKEQLDSRKIQSEIDRTYYDMGVLTSDEIRSSRFENGYSNETVLEEEPDEYIEPEPIEQPIEGEEKQKKNDNFKFIRSILK